MSERLLTIEEVREINPSMLDIQRFLTQEWGLYVDVWGVEKADGMYCFHLSVEGHSADLHTKLVESFSGLESEGLRVVPSDDAIPDDAFDHWFEDDE